MSYQNVEVLLVEDSDADAEMTLRTLRRRGIANRIERVHDGVDALDYLRLQGSHAARTSGLPRLVLLDLKMPRMDGLQVLREMKSDARLRMIPVVMMTSSREEGDLLESYELGVNSYVVKPVDFGEFATQRRLVRHPHQPQPVVVAQHAPDHLRVRLGVLHQQDVQRARLHHSPGAWFAIIQYMPTWAIVSANSPKSTGLTT